MNTVKNNTYSKRWLILFTVVSATFMSTLDGSIINVALPDMSIKLNAPMASIEWVVTGFLITILATILIFGRLGDIKGKTKMFRFGVILFSVGSLLCGLTNSLTFLIAARSLQAIGAAATMATNQGIITQVFPANERGSALGIVGTFVALGGMAGPPLGGFIISIASWKYIFLINVPIGIIVFLISLKIFPQSTKVADEKFDIKGSILFIVFAVLMFGALVHGQTIGYKNPAMISAFIISIIAFILFIYSEKKEKYPLLQLDIFSNSLFSISIICGFVSFVSISASNIILPFYFEDAMSLSPSVTGLYMMVSPIVLSVVAPLSGHLSDRIGSEVLTLIGLVLTSVGLFLISTLTQNSAIIMIVVFIIIMTLGNGMFQSPNNSLIMSTVSKDKLGIAGSVNALVRNLGFVLGTSLSTLLLYNRMSHKIGYRVIDYVKGRSDVFMYGMKYVYICACALCIFGAIITAFRLFSSKKESEQILDNISNKNA